MRAGRPAQASPVTVSTPFAEYPVGASLGPIRLEVTAEMAARFAQAVDSTCSWYVGASPFGGPIAPYTAIEQVMLVTLGDAYRVSDAPGGTVQHRLAVNYRRPAAVGSVLTISGRTLEKATFARRYQSSFGFEVVTDDGALVMDGTVTQAHLLGGAERAGSKEGGKALPLAPNDVSTPADPCFPAAELPMTLESMRLYAAWPPLAQYGRSLENQHTNENEARRLGRPGVIAMGCHLVGYLQEYLLQRLGRSWLTTGRLDIAFVGMVLVGDTLSVSARSRGPDADGRLTLDVLCATRRGTAVTGTASVAASRSMS